MGCCASDPESQKGELQKELNREKKKDANVKKLLFLGSGGSGKSTMFKQIRRIYTYYKGQDDGANNSEFKKELYKLIIWQMNRAINSVETLRKKECFSDFYNNDEFKNVAVGGSGEGEGGRIGEGEGGSGKAAEKKEIDQVNISWNDLQFSRNGQISVNYFKNMKSDDEKPSKLENEVVKHIKILWQEKPIKCIYAVRNSMHISESMGYFCDNIDKFASYKYEPDEYDKDLVGAWTDQDRLSFVDHIHAQIIEQMKLAIELVGELAEEELADDYKKPDDFNAFDSLSDAGKNAVTVLQCVKDPKLNAEIVEACKTLWEEPKIKEIYDKRGKMKIEDSSAYFWENIDRIYKSGYIPNYTDMLLVRYRTTGVIDMKLQSLDKSIYHIFDVGGQKSERKKWIHCFEHVTAVLFCASLSCYNEVMFEDEGVNSMVDQLQLFDSIVNNEWFVETGIILLLTKKDLFAEKLERIPITYCPEFEGYDGVVTSFDDNVAYIRDAFIAKNKGRNKQILSHTVCCTDENNVEKVFNDCRQIIINQSLSRAGLIGEDEENANAALM